MRVARLAALLVFAAVQQTAAQEVDPRLFDARVAPGSLIGLDTTSVVGHLDFYAGLAATIANDELVGDDPTGTVPRGPLRERLVSTLGVGLGFFDALALEVALPLHTTEEIVGDGRSTAFGIGDLRISARWRIVGPDVGQAGVGLGLQLAAHLPTGSAPFGTDGGLVLDPRLVFEWRSAGGIGLVVEAAYRLRETRVIADLAIGDEVRWGAGVELPFGAFGASLPLALVTEVEGGIGLATAAADPDGAASARKLPVEARLGLRLHAATWALTAAAGTGITDGYGTPDYRFVLGFTWGPATLPRPPSDAVVTTVIDPASAPEPTFPAAPGFALATGTSSPGGPSGAALPPEVKAALDQAVAADPDPDGDGVPVPADQCPAEREDPDDHDDGDGCPDLDDDGDGVVDAKDKCLDQKETPNGIDDDDGCPDEGQAGVVASGGRIELTQTIEFNSGSDVLAPSAAPILAQVAAVLKANPQVKRVRIEGHTDNEGDEEMNVDLAERRAGRVRLTLVKAGVAPERLLPKGFGATRPIAPNTTPEGRKKNRRVALEVIDPPPPGAPRVDFEGTP